MSLVGLTWIAALGASLLPSKSGDAKPTPDAASPSTLARNARFLASLPSGTGAEDYDFVQRGFIATRNDPRIVDENGNLVWDLDAYANVRGSAPPTVNPSLWRQVGLLAVHGLFEVTDRVYQVRNFGASNVTFIESDTGVIVVNPTISAEATAAAMELFKAHRGEKAVKAILYMASHSDHWAGIRAVASASDLAEGRIPIIAPKKFLHEIEQEIALTGNAMGRRAHYLVAGGVETSPVGNMTLGISLGAAQGSMALVPPTRLVTHTGEVMTIDGVTFEFQLPPDGDMPVDMHIYLPQFRTLLMAESAPAGMHNVLPPRGAQVRDAKIWSQYLDETVALFGARSDHLAMTHTWPRFGKDRISKFISDQSDMYRFMHDQTIRLANMGLNGEEIAETIAFPENIKREWYTREYYGSLKFNVHGIYQRYLGWFDGNPANLDRYSPVEKGRRYVTAMGGPAAVLKAGKNAIEEGDYRWATEVLNNLVMSEPRNKQGRELLAQAYMQMAYQSENGAWRNFYLTGAAELRNDARTAAMFSGANDIFGNLPTSAIFDMLSVRVDPAKSKQVNVSVRFVFEDRKEDNVLSLRNDVMRHETYLAQPVGATVRMPQSAFLSILSPDGGDEALKLAKIEGDRRAVETLFGAFSAPDPSFPIVTR